MSHEKPLPVYGPFEVVIHNSPHDCWLSFLGKVFDVTPLVKQYEGQRCIKPILAFAGKDVSQWFDEKTGDLQHYVHPVTGVEVPFCRHGPLPEVQVEVPSTQWRPYDALPWWLSGKYQIGVLTKSVRPIRIINMLLGKEVLMDVCCEDSFERISERYSIFNKEAGSYTWVYTDRLVDMTKTMDENGIPDERDKMAELGIPRNSYIPSVRLYFNDDLGHLSDLTDDEDELDKEVCCECKNKREEKINVF